MVSQKKWGLQTNCDVIIFDACNADVLYPYLSHADNVCVLDIAGKSVSMLCLLQAFMSKRFWTGRFLEAYADAFISCKNPKLIITFIDNNPIFYKFSERWPAVKTILVQNGNRGAIDFWNKKREHNYVDFMFVFGEEVRKKYEEFIRGEVVVHGSLINNMLPVDKKFTQNKKKKKIVFISQVEKASDGVNDIINTVSCRVSYEQFYAADRKILELLSSWCEDKGYALSILARKNHEDDYEEQFFKSALSHFSFSFIKKTSKYDSYAYIDSSDIIVFVDSTLGYEALARGKKSAAFPCRGFGLESLGYKFGWPGSYSDSGPFWTNDLNKAEFCRIMDYLDVVPQIEWQTVLDKTMPGIMSYDDNNSQLRRVIDEILLKAN